MHANYNNVDIIMCFHNSAVLCARLYNMNTITLNYTGPNNASVQVLKILDTNLFMFSAMHTDSGKGRIVK